MVLEIRSNVGTFSVQFKDVSTIVETSSGTNITMNNGNVFRTSNTYAEVLSTLTSFRAKPLCLLNGSN